MSAIALNENQVAHELIPQLEGVNSLPFKFQLKRIKEGKDKLIIDDDLTNAKEIWQDYQPNNLAWPLISVQLKEVIEKYLTGNECIDWLSCKVSGINDERIYYVLRFNKLLDVLDLQKTMFVRGTDHIVKPVFSFSKIKNYTIFYMPSSYNLWKITSGIYISETLKEAIQKESLTGVEFQVITVV